MSSKSPYRNNPKHGPNRVQCVHCKDVIESKHVHDYVQCSCGKVAVDGGQEYHKRVGNENDYIELSG